MLGYQGEMTEPVLVVQGGYRAVTGRVRDTRVNAGALASQLRDPPWQLLASLCCFLHTTATLSIFYLLCQLVYKLQESRSHAWLIHHHILAPETLTNSRMSP